MIGTLMEMKDRSAESLEAVRELERICKAIDSSDLRVGVESLAGENGDNAYLWIAEDRLVGFLSWYVSADGTEASLNGMVHPAYRLQGVFRNLLNRAKRDMETHGIRTLRFRVPSNSPAGIGCLARMNARFSSAEYAMRFDGFAESEPGRADVRLRERETGDFEFIVRCSSEAFGEPENWTRNYFSRTAEPGRTTYIGLLDGTPVGMIRVNRLETGTAVIHDFCVLPSLQGKGIGSGMLASSVRLLLAERCGHIRLSVVTGNAQALSVYRNAGFRITAENHYYVKPIFE